ncbi:DedA family protein [Candidatus Sulfurimonas marisnigri]|uniref:DedA family protein n=1 Tax=Candidatus Sulfurimonas marisnigri TaxID=2740405 RepID=A0A7S7M183_9BACT|nr:DedA family protein [Candidatus Sulfurimonas marisnigri]QOY54708.1 DedA family protein [Candidatus Sulfurimonas marisnigri]
MPLLTALIFASTGNILAIIVNYFLGYFLYEKTHTKLYSSKIGAKALLYGHKYGYYALLLSWLPIIGDPLTLVAGLVRLKFVWFVLISGSLRVLRYYFLTLMV